MCPEMAMAKKHVNFLDRWPLPIATSIKSIYRWWYHFGFVIYMTFRWLSVIKYTFLWIQCNFDGPSLNNLHFPFFSSCYMLGWVDDLLYQYKAGLALSTIKSSHTSMCKSWNSVLPPPALALHSLITTVTCKHRRTGFFSEALTDPCLSCTYGKDKEDASAVWDEASWGKLHWDFHWCQPIISPQVRGIGGAIYTAR